MRTSSSNFAILGSGVGVRDGAPDAGTALIILAGGEARGDKPLLPTAVDWRPQSSMASAPCVEVCRAKAVTKVRIRK